MKLLFGYLFCFLIHANVFGQLTDIAVIYHHSVEETTFELLHNEGEIFSLKPNPFIVRTIDVDDNHPQLNVSGDFDGDGLDEVAVFNDLLYTPNLNPAFTCSVIKVYKSTGEKLRPVHTWFSILDTLLDFDFVNFSCASDFNEDGNSDLAVIMDDTIDLKLIFPVFEGSLEGQMAPVLYGSIPSSSMGLAHVEHAIAGEFSGEVGSDLVLFFDDPVTGGQEVLVLQSETAGFNLPTKYYVSSPALMVFNELSTLVAGNFVYRPLVTATT